MPEEFGKQKSGIDIENEKYEYTFLLEGRKSVEETVKTNCVLI